MKDFKFFQREQKIDYFNYLGQLAGAMDELRRRTNMLTHDNVPQDVIDCGEVGAYEQGYEAGLSSTGFNPYHDQLRGEIWNRGFWTATNLIHRQ